MKSHQSIVLMALVSVFVFGGCSLFPSQTSRPLVYPVPTTPAVPHVPVTDNATVTSSPNTVITDGLQENILTEQACKAAHGNWNGCASPCRNQPDAQVCIESCMQVCECGGIAGFGCPSGYECTEYVPGPNVPDAMGICKLSTKKETSGLHEFINKKTLTSVTVAGVEDNDRVRVANPFIFHGTTTVFESQFAWRVKDGKNIVVASGLAFANSPDAGQPGPFKVKAFFDKLPSTKDGLLEVYYSSFKDGSDVMLLSVKLSFETMEMVETRVFFSNTKKDPEMLDCSNVYPVVRKVVATKQGEDAYLHALLQGPTEAEKKLGYLTQLPERVTDPAMGWNAAGQFIVDFDQSVQQGVGGSCRTSAIRAQIEKTLDLACKKGVCVIRVDGDSDTALQP